MDPITKGGELMLTANRQQKPSKSIWLVEHELGAATDGSTEVLQDYRGNLESSGSAGARLNEALGRHPMLVVLGGVMLGFVVGSALPR